MYGAFDCSLAYFVRKAAQVPRRRAGRPWPSITRCRLALGLPLARARISGAHFDTKRDSDLEKLDRASRYVKYGGPHPGPDWEPDSEIYMVLEPSSNEILSGLHIEIIAAATSFIKFGGTPIMKLTTKTSLRTRLRRLLGRDKARFRFFDTSKAR